MSDLVIPGFKHLLRIRSRSVPTPARDFWKEVSALRFDERERRALESVDTARRTLESDAREFRRTDFGVGPSRATSSRGSLTSVAGIAKKASISTDWGHFLFKMVRAVNAQRVLELGSCAGLSTAYLQTALDLNGGTSLVSVEGDPFLCGITRETLSSVSSNPGDVVEGLFQNVLPSLLPQHPPFDFVFIDGHHDPVATVMYFGMISPYLSSGSIVVLDDIQPLTGAVRPAWKTIVSGTPHRWAVDLVRMGAIEITTAQ